MGSGNRVEEDITQGGTTTVTKFAQQVVNHGAAWNHLPATWADLNASNQDFKRWGSMGGRPKKT
jgi:hypothetical protein